LREPELADPFSILPHKETALERIRVVAHAASRRQLFEQFTVVVRRIGFFLSNWVR
jgi:hypothetical protein